MICEKRCPSVINRAIAHRHVEVVAQIIRGGVDVTRRSYSSILGKMLPFETFVLFGNFYVAGSCGVFNFNTDHIYKAGVNHKFKCLTKTFKVHKNNALSLHQQCRREILNSCLLMQIRRSDILHYYNYRTFSLITSAYLS